MLNICSCAFHHLYVFFGEKYLFISSAHFFSLGCLFALDIELYELFAYFGD